MLSYLQDVSAHQSLKGNERLVEVGLGAWLQALKLAKELMRQWWRQLQGFYLFPNHRAIFTVSLLLWTFSGSVCYQVGPSGSLTCSCSTSDHKWLQDCVITIEYHIAGNFQSEKTCVSWCKIEFFQKKTACLCHQICHVPKFCEDNISK